MAWDIDILPRHLKLNLHAMPNESMIILMNKDTISGTYKEWQDCMSIFDINCYASLHNIISIAHLALIKNHAETIIPM